MIVTDVLQERLHLLGEDLLAALMGTTEYNILGLVPRSPVDREVRSHTETAKAGVCL